MGIVIPLAEYKDPPPDRSCYPIAVQREDGLWIPMIMLGPKAYEWPPMLSEAIALELATIQFAGMMHVATKYLLDLAWVEAV